MRIFLYSLMSIRVARVNSKSRLGQEEGSFNSLFFLNLTISPFHVGVMTMSIAFLASIASLRLGQGAPNLQTSNPCFALFFFSFPQIRYCFMLCVAWSPTFFIVDTP